WLAGAWWLLPRLVRSAYDGTSLPFLNALISGQDVHPVERYLAQAERLAAGGTVVLAAGIVLAFLVAAYREPLGRTFRRLCRTEPRGSAARIVALAATLGIGFGALEAGAVWTRFRLAGVISEGNNPDTLWMAPAVLGIFFALIGIGLFVALGDRERGLSYRIVVAVCVALGAYGVLRGLRWGLYTWSVWLLAVALGVQLARVLDRRPGALRRLRRAALPATVVLSGAILLVPLGESFLERRHLASLPDAGDLPDVLLIVLDTVRGENMGLYGYERPNTPAIEQRAAEGLAFEHAIATSPWTLPTHASLFTGRWDHELSTDWETPLDDEHRTLAEFLSENGYATAAFVANLGNAAETTGLGRGFARYADHPRSWEGWLVSAFVPRRVSRWIWPRISTRWSTLGRRYAPDITDDALGWIEELPDRPYFAFLNYFDAHAPYEIHEPFLTRFPSEPPDTVVLDAGGEPQAISYRLQRAIDGYDTSIALIDEEIGRLLDALEARGTLDNTIVVITSDHGEHLGDHGLMDHGNSLYAQLLRVPLVLRYPGRVPAGGRVVEPVSLRDIPSMILDLAGLESPFPGRSLLWAADAGGSLLRRPLLAEVSAAPHEGFYEGPTSRGDMKSVVVGPLHYILNGDGAEELYDLTVDPDEVNDLSETERGHLALPELRAALGRALAREAPDPALASTENRAYGK
ncbi:MAG: sulfatase, partial [Gemmatimonadota bacterium]|nr:sulfatase [Gemmatimonadota bacterium]